MYNGILEQDLKWRKSVIYDMDEPEGHYVEWNKPGTERQILHDLTYVECRTIKFVETV